MSKALGPLLEFTDTFSAEDYATISCVKPVLQIVCNNILQAKENDTDLMKTIKKSVLEYMTSSYGDTVTEELINLATLFDPRFCTEYISKSESKAIQARADEEMESLLSEQSPSCI